MTETATTTATMTAPEASTAEVEKISKNKQRVNELKARTAEGISDIFENNKMQEYLDVMARFHDYSAGNNVLIMQQNPQATRVEGYNAWINDYERQVASKEKGVVILAPDYFKKTEEQDRVNQITGKPMFGGDGKQLKETIIVTIPYLKPVTVFDVSQTYGKKLPAHKSPELNGNVKDFDLFFKALKEAAPYKFSLAEIEGGGKGNCSFKNREITINESMSESDIVKAAIQGIALLKARESEDAKSHELPPKEPETIFAEVEAIAYTVCKHYGIDTTGINLERVSEWGAGKEVPELRGLLDSVNKAADSLIKGVDSKIIELTNDRLPDLTPPVPEPPQDKPAIFGNISYRDIKDKKHYNVHTDDAPKIAAELEAQGVKFSAKEQDNNKTTFAVSEADSETFKHVEKTFNIIGNTAFADIIDRQYFPHDNNTAQKIAAELETQGVNFSGRIKGNKTTLTIGAADVEAYKEIEKAITGQQIIAEQPAKAEIYDNFPLSDVPPPEPPPLHSELPPPPEAPTTPTPPIKTETPVKAEKTAKKEPPETPAKAAKGKENEKPTPKKTIKQRIAEGKTSDKGEKQKAEPTKTQSKKKEEHEI